MLGLWSFDWHNQWVVAMTCFLLLRKYFVLCMILKTRRKALQEVKPAALITELSSSPYHLCFRE